MPAALHIGGFRWARQEDGTWRANAQGTNWSPDGGETEITVRERLVADLLPVKGPDGVAWYLEIQGTPSVVGSWPLPNLKQAAARAGAELRKHILTKLPKDDPRNCRIELPTETMDLIDSTLVKGDMPALYPDPTLAQIGTQLVELYLQANPKKRKPAT